LDRTIEEAQHHGCNVKPIDDKKCEDIARRLLHLEKIFALGIGKENSHLILRVDGKTEPLTPGETSGVTLDIGRLTLVDGKRDKNGRMTIKI
jgi:hypothetical protein